MISGKSNTPWAKLGDKLGVTAAPTIVRSPLANLI
jgi:hypothetical protein